MPNNNKNHPYILILCLTILIFFPISCIHKNNSSKDDTNSSNTSDDNQENNNTKIITPISRSSFKLNTIVTITLYDSDNEKLLDECIRLCDYYESLFSKTLEDSEIYILNHIRTHKVSDETKELITKGLYYSSLTDGAFNILIAPLTNLWDFVNVKKVPDESSIHAALSHIDYNNVTIENNTITISDKESGFDLGAIAKGYIADRIKDYLISQGVKSAIIDLGGNLLLIGGRLDGTAFNIGIQKPFEAYSEIIAVMKLHDVSIVSSGIYERYFIEDSKLYHHILDTKTGYPCDNGLISVTIISKYSADGDALSTSVFALGLEKGLELINSLEDTYAVFINSDYELIYSDGFLENISIE